MPSVARGPLPDGAEVVTGEGENLLERKNEKNTKAGIMFKSNVAMVVLQRF